MRSRTLGFTSSWDGAAAARALALVGIAVSAGRSQDLPERLPSLGSAELQDPLLSDAAPVACYEGVMDADSDCCGCGGWCWQMLPDGLIYPSYMAGGKGARIAA